MRGSSAALLVQPSAAVPAMPEAAALPGVMLLQALSADSHPDLARMLAEKAAELGARLLPAFDSPSGGALLCCWGGWVKSQFAASGAVSAQGQVQCLLQRWPWRREHRLRCSMIAPARMPWCDPCCPVAHKTGGPLF